MSSSKIWISAALMAVFMALHSSATAQRFSDSTLLAQADSSEAFATAITDSIAIAITDSIAIDGDTTDSLPRLKNPKVAGWLSFAVPGAGQIYNGQYWKVPIIYGGLGTLIYVSQFYGTRVKQLKNDEKFILGDTIGNSRLNLFGLTNESDIVGYLKKYRRYRDLCYVGMALVYVMNIFDAVVDAHLYDYDVSDDISLRIEPCATNPVFAFQKPAFGARLVLRF